MEEKIAVEKIHKNVEKASHDKSLAPEVRDILAGVDELLKYGWVWKRTVDVQASLDGNEIVRDILAMPGMYTRQTIGKPITPEARELVMKTKGEKIRALVGKRLEKYCKANRRVYNFRDINGMRDYLVEVTVSIIAYDLIPESSRIQIRKNPYAHKESCFAKKPNPYAVKHEQLTSDFQMDEMLKRELWLLQNGLWQEKTSASMGKFLLNVLPILDEILSIRPRKQIIELLSNLIKKRKVTKVPVREQNKLTLADAYNGVIYPAKAA